LVLPLAATSEGSGWLSLLQMRRLDRRLLTEAVPADAAEGLRGFTRAVDAQARGYSFAA